MNQPLIEASDRQVALRNASGSNVRRRRGWGALAHRWRDSLAFRVVTVTIISSLLVMTLLGVLITSQVRERVFQGRVEQVLEDASVQAADAQRQFNASTASTPSQIQQEATDLVTQLQGTTYGAVGTVLMRDETDTEAVSIPEPATDPELRGLITDELRASVVAGGPIHWQSVSLPTTDAPGIVVGAPINLPVVGDFQLFMFYTLEAEQTTLSMLTSVLSIGATGLVIVVGIGVAVIVQWVLRPVRQAARTAERLAAGLLDERMEIGGEDELAVLGQSFNEMADSLQQQIEEMAELSRLQQRFVSDVSHELRTPLTTIQMAGEMLFEAREDFPASERRSAELLHTQIERFDHMLADLLEISRYDSGSAVLEAEDHDIRNLTQQVVEDASILADRKDVRLNLHFPDMPVTAEVDPRRFERAVRNLVVNAIEHAEGKPVDITVAGDDQTVAVLVRDHGVGMSPHEVSRVFDRFWRGDPARARTTGGTGLGLSIAAEDVRLHGGQLLAAGQKGEGAAFLVLLPLRAGEPRSTQPLRIWPDADGEEVLIAATANESAEDLDDEDAEVADDVDQDDDLDDDASAGGATAARTGQEVER